MATDALVTPRTAPQADWQPLDLGEADEQAAQHPNDDPLDELLLGDLPSLDDVALHLGLLPLPCLPPLTTDGAPLLAHMPTGVRAGVLSTDRGCVPL
jgi:hypothetical protein